ncbi:MAG: hypothetical protein HC927_12930 [Deltaproteobacteria bacterium]|nr:hypothetical protein [Deltaproteobacteria bacterium]
MKKTALTPLLFSSLLLTACPSDDTTPNDEEVGETATETADTAEDLTTDDESSTTDSTTTTTDDTTTDDTTTEGTDTGDDNCAGPFADCAALQAAFAAETQAIRSCSTDSQCGQDLQGTSCGCTRNWVARTDADTTCFYELIELAGPLQCELGLASTCDCPAAEGFVCEAGICQWNYL